MIFVIVPELRVDELGSDECVVDRVGNLTVVTVQANLPGIAESIWEIFLQIPETGPYHNQSSWED